MTDDQKEDPEEFKTKPREGWEEIFKNMSQEDAVLLIPDVFEDETFEE